MPKLKSLLLSYQTPVLMSLLIVSISQASRFRLHQLNIVFRHGDRTPDLHPTWFPNDPNMKRTFYPMGSGGLTNEGKQRMYRFGKLLRYWYSEFLGVEFEENKVFAISSSLARTKMSLQLVVAGLYPPFLSPNKWHSQLNWQPVPMFYNNFDADPIFTWDRCDAYFQELQKVYNSASFQKKLEPYKNFLEYVRIVSGKEKPLKLENVLLLLDNLRIEKRMNLPMQPWMTDLVTNQTMIDLSKLHYTLIDSNDLLKRLSSGMFIRRINEDMISATNKTLNYPRKVSLYSGHDHNIVGILQSLNIYNGDFVQFGSALIFELLSLQGKYYVKISHFLGIPEALRIYTIPGCTAICPLDKFIHLTKNAQITDQDLKSKISIKNYFENS